MYSAHVINDGDFTKTVYTLVCAKKIDQQRINLLKTLSDKRKSIQRSHQNSTRNPGIQHQQSRIVPISLLLFLHSGLQQCIQLLRTTYRNVPGQRRLQVVLHPIFVPGLLVWPSIPSNHNLIHNYYSLKQQLGWVFLGVQ